MLIHVRQNRNTTKYLLAYQEKYMIFISWLVSTAALNIATKFEISRLNRYMCLENLDLIHVITVFTDT